MKRILIIQGQSDKSQPNLCHALADDVRAKKREQWHKLMRALDVRNI